MTWLEFLLSDENVERVGECAIWRHAKSNGYPEARIDGRKQRIHRVVLFLSKPDTDPSLDACHSCDNPPCIEPTHLFGGTARDNALDMVAKNRINIGIRRTGQDSHLAVLSNNEVLEIRRKYASGQYTQRGLAKEYNIGQTTVGHIVRREQWRSLP